MRLLVCIKQVPKNEPGCPCETDAQTLEKSFFQLDPFSAYALEGAARIRDHLPDTEITALSLGRAEEVLRECLAIAADQACQVDGVPLEPLAASWCLAQVVRMLEKTGGMFDAILCGDQSVLGDSRPLGAELAEWLNRPQTTGVLEAEFLDGGFLARRRGSGGEERVWTATPCLLAFNRPDDSLRYPTMPRYLAANRAEIFTFENINCPIKANFPQIDVLKTYPPRPREDRVLLRAENGETAAAQMIQALSNARLI